MEASVPEYIDSNVSSIVCEGPAFPQPLPIRRPLKQSFIESELQKLYCDLGKTHLHYLKKSECEICYENNIEIMLSQFVVIQCVKVV